MKTTYLKTEDDLKSKNNLKNEDDLKNEDNIQNEGDLKTEDDLKNWPSIRNYFPPPPLKKLTDIFLTTSHLDSHKTTDVQLDMLLCVKTGNGIPHDI